MLKNLYFGAFTRRHMGAARTREKSPAAISQLSLIGLQWLGRFGRFWPAYKPPLR
jgi:hypothetical protein